MVAVGAVASATSNDDHWTPLILAHVLDTLINLLSLLLVVLEV